MSTSVPLDGPAGPGPATRFTSRRVFYGICWLTLVVALATVPMPFFALYPGSAVDIAPLVQIEGGPRTPVDGTAALLSVSVVQPSILELLAARFDDRVEIEPTARFLPPGEDDDTYFANQADIFDGAFAISAAVALRAAGEQVTVTSLPEIVQILPGSPADGVLEVGDLVQRLNGVAVATADELVAQARLLADGDRVDLVLERDGTSIDVVLRAGQVGRMTRPGIGVSVDTTPRTVDLPFDVRLRDDVAIGGPSAGLMFGIAVYDLVAQEDLLMGRRVAGTGTLELDGRIGRIGSIHQKVHAAEEAGYTIFLAPASQAAEAQEVASESLLIIPVETFEDALAALREAPGTV